MSKLIERHQLEAKYPIIQKKYIRIKQAYEACLVDNGLNTTEVLSNQLKLLRSVQDEFISLSFALSSISTEFENYHELCAQLQDAGVQFSTDDNLNIYIGQ